MKHKNIKSKRVLITGVTGFIGQHLTDRLRADGANVFGISSSKESKGIIKASITDVETINEIMKQKKIQICFHLAGESLVEKGQASPYQTFRTNILGTLNVLESARENNLEKIIIASTSHVYGKNKLPYYEGYPPKPSRPYETSKTCVDLIAQSYADTYNLPVLIPRFVNIYGPGDLNFNRLIPKVMKGILHDEALTMWGGEAKRDYLYVDDAVNAYINLARIDISKIMKNRIFNFGSGNVLSVKEIVEHILRASGRTIQIKKIQNERELEIKTIYVSYKKAERLLRWKPRTGIVDGLRKSLIWYQDYFKSFV